MSKRKNNYPKHIENLIEILLKGQEVTCTRYVSGDLRRYFYSHKEHGRKVHVVESAWSWVTITLVPNEQVIRWGWSRAADQERLI